VCVYCDVCVHLLPDCCRFLGDQLRCIDCYKTRHVYIRPHAGRDRVSCQLMAKKDDASNDVKTPPEPNDKARLEDELKSAVKNEEVENKDDTSKDLKAPPEPKDEAKKEDERKPAAVNKKVDDATLKMKEPPKPADKEDQTDDKKPEAKEEKQDKNKRLSPKLPLHPNSTCKFPKSIGKSPNMDLDLEDT
jgi:hypothetical protein